MSECLDPRDASWICDDCAIAAGARPIPEHIATYHEGECSVCSQTRVVTEPRDFRWPE